MTLAPANSHANGYPLGLTGAVSPTRYVGGTATVAPTAGTFAVGDFVIAANAKIFVCTVAGTPGTWVQATGSGGATELDYVTRATDLTITATSAATAETWIDGNPVTYDGATRVLIEVYAELMTGTTDAILELYDGVTDIGRICQFSNGGGSQLGRYFVTPTGGSHTYKAKAWKATVGSILSSLGCPSYLRITTA